MYYILALSDHNIKSILCSLIIFGSITYIFLALFSYYFCAGFYFSQKCTVLLFHFYFGKVNAFNINYIKFYIWGLAKDI